MVRGGGGGGGVRGEPLNLCGGETLVWAWEGEYKKWTAAPSSHPTPTSTGGLSSPASAEPAFKIFSAAEKEERARSKQGQ